MTKYKSLALLGLVVLLAGCGSTGGGLGDIFGGGNGSTQAQAYEIRGTVESVDVNNRSVYLTNVSGYGSMLSSGGNSNVRVYYDDRTPVDWQGRSYRPEDLERGDQIAVRVDESNNRLYANSMSVTYNANASNNSPNNNYPNNGGYGTPSNASTVRGTVRYIDTNRRTIELGSTSWMSGFTTGSGSGGTITVAYDNNSNVDVSGKLYPVTGLEAGDVIEVQVTNPSSSLPFAQRITLIRNARN
jgi:hypothetical protein